MSLEDEILAHILETYLPGESPSALQVDDDLIDTGILDSFGIIQLVNHIEREYDISIPTEDIDPEHFASVKALAAFIRQRTESK